MSRITASSEKYLLCMQLLSCWADCGNGIDSSIIKCNALVDYQLSGSCETMNKVVSMGGKKEAKITFYLPYNEI